MSLITLRLMDRMISVMQQIDPGHNLTVTATNSAALSKYSRATWQRTAGCSNCGKQSYVVEPDGQPTKQSMRYV